jgi:hypothetical protein
VQHRVTAAAASVGVDGTTLLDTGVATPSWNATLTDASVFVRAPPSRRPAPLRERQSRRPRARSVLLLRSARAAR